MKATSWAVSMQKLIIDRWGMRERYHKKPAKVRWKQKHGTDSYCVDVVLTAVTAARFTRRVERLTEAVFGRNPHHWSPVSWWGPEKCEKWGEKWVRKNRWWSGFVGVFKGGGGGKKRSERATRKNMNEETERWKRQRWGTKRRRRRSRGGKKGKDEGRRRRRRRRCHSKEAQLETGRPWNLSRRRWEVKVNTQARNISTPADDWALNAELSHFIPREVNISTEEPVSSLLTRHRLLVFFFFFYILTFSFLRRKKKEIFPALWQRK